MLAKDVRCNKCGKVFEIYKKSIMTEWEIPNCIECKSSDVSLCFGVGDVDMAKGRFGNASNGYTETPIYHPSKYGRFKGTTVKSVK